MPLDRRQFHEFTKEQLIDTICDQAIQIETLKSEIAALKKDSSTSSKPPSTDRKPNRTQSLRQPSGKPNGGQPGHQGATRLQVENPDMTIPCRPHHCARCGAGLAGVPGTPAGTRQEADIPPIQITVTAYRREEVVCPCCGERNRGSFPEGVNAPFQIGLNLKSLVVYLNIAHHIPFERLTDILSDLLAIRISQGTIDNTLNDAERAGAALAAEILSQIKREAWVGSDETGTRVMGDNWWQWTWQNLAGAYYAIEPSRGSDVVEAHFGSDYRGKLLHDCWAAQNNTPARAHQLCHPHLLRDLQFCREAERSRWANTMAHFLLETEQARDAVWREGYDPRQRERAIRSYHRRFQRLIRGQVKGKETRTLLKRFQKHADKILTFLSDPDLPFHNNSSEQAIRNAKLHKKVSGGFRSERGARRHAVLLSIVETCKKRKMDILASLKLMLQGRLSFQAP